MAFRKVGQAVWPALLFWLAVPCAGGSAETIYARESWYRERSEPERHWRGVLRRREPERGPASRSALLFTLETRSGSLPVYAAGVAEKLAGYADRRVLARAKLVDLRQEGYGRELWIGTIERLSR
jgi:hypothetical protein